MSYEIFQNLAFPIALAVVLLYAVRSLYKSYIDYLTKQNERLTNIINECTKALNKNTEVFEKLINDFFTKD